MWSCDNFSAPFMGLYLPNAWSQTLQTSKRQSQSLQSLGFSSVPLVWGKTVSCRLYAGSSKGTLKREKCYFWGSGSAHAKKNSGIFHDSTRPHLHFDGLPPKSRRFVVSTGRVNKNIPLQSLADNWSTVYVTFVIFCRTIERL